MPLTMRTRRAAGGAVASADAKQAGLQALQDKCWLEAAGYLEKAMEQDPSDVEVMNALALAQHGLGDGKAARSTLGRAAKLAPDYPGTYRNLAVLLASEGRVLEAADNVCRAVELDPADEQSLRLLRELRGVVRTIKPPAKKQSRKQGRTSGPSQEDINSRLRRMNSALARDDNASEAGRATRPKISLCMIVRDEEAFLEDCLKSVEGVADEVVIVDTGSTDRTVRIAEACGASVHHHEWTDNFSEVRNAALERAAGDWILVLDADERLDAGSKAAVLRAVSKPTADAYELTVRNYRSSSPTPEGYTHRVCRLYRNRPEYRYRGRVHEQIAASIAAAAGRVGRLNALVHHYGYRPEALEERSKHERYIPLLEADLKEDPRDPRCLYNLGMAYWSSGQAEKAIDHLEPAAQLVTASHEYASPIFCALVNMFCATGRPDRAISTADRAERMGVYHPEINFSRGNALLLLGRCREAIQQFEAAIRTGRAGEWVGDIGALGYKALFGIASAYMALGDHRKAAESCRQAIAEKPEDAQSHELLARAYLHLGRTELAEKHYLQAIELKPEYARAHAGLGKAYGAQGRIGDALQCFVKALELDPAQSACYFDAGDVLCSVGRYQEAAGVYENGLACDPQNAQGFVALGDCYSQMGAYEAAVLAYRQALAIRPDCPEAADRLASADRALANSRAA